MDLAYFNLATIGIDLKEKDELWRYCEKYNVTLRQFDEFFTIQTVHNESISELQEIEEDNDLSREQRMKRSKL
jgi:hypothetical protein